MNSIPKPLSGTFVIAIFVFAVVFFVDGVSDLLRSSAQTEDADIAFFDIRNDDLATQSLGAELGNARDLREIDSVKKHSLIAAEELRRKMPSTDLVQGRLSVPEILSVGPFRTHNLFTEPSTEPRVATLRRFLNENASFFGLQDAQPGELEVIADYSNPDGNLSFVHLRQLVNGVPVFQGEIEAGFTRRNELFRIANDLAPGLSADRLSTDFGDGARALSDAVRLTGAEPLFGGEPEKFYFPIAFGVARPAWRTRLAKNGREYYILTDAETGKLLWLKSLTEDQTQPSNFEIYGNTASLMKTADSPSPFTPGCPSPMNCAQPPPVARQTFTLIGNEPPYGFNNLGWLPDGETRTVGNNAEAGIDRDGTQGIDPNGWAFGNPNRNFVFAYNPAPGIPPPGEQPLPSPQTYPPSAFQQGAATHAFYLANRWHDEMYRFGFTEQARNFQTDNFGRGGLGADSLSVEIQDGSGTNGANFSTPADGGRGRLQLFVWTGPTPDRDGALDSQIAVHELTHGLSSRLHGNGTGLGSNMSRGMGEGWSDFYALALLSEPADDPCGTNSVGGYITYQIFSGYESNYYHGLRRFPTARRQCAGPNGLPHNPLTFRYINADCNTLIGTTSTNPSSAFPRGPIGVATCDQIHNIGEVWSAALWEVRGFLMDQHGAAEGNRRSLQYVTDGMKLAPLNPTLLQERDAIIAAVTASDPGDVISVRRGFAVRGMGASATIQNAGTGSNNTVVTEAFDIVANAAIGSGFSVSDAIGNNNGFIEPGERVTVTVPLINTSGVTLTGVNLIAPDLNVSAFYGDIPDGQTVVRNLDATIPANAPCGGNYVISFDISSSAGQTTRTRTVFTGAPQSSATFASTTAVTINDNGPTTPYGTTIDVSGLTGTENRMTMEVTGVSHTFPSDLDMLLVGPSGQTFIAVSDTGGTTPVGKVTFSLTDFASTALSAAAWSAGSYRPADIGAGDAFPAPAPSGPYSNPAPAGTATFGSSFSANAANLNGIWTLYIVDDGQGDGGALAGWKLKFDTFSCVVCRACLTGARADFDGDGRADLSVFRPSDGIWYEDRSAEGFTAFRWGLAGDRITPGDFNGDGRTDIAVFRPAADPTLPDFYVLSSGGAACSGVSWGLPGDVPVIGDYDGDGLDDIAVYRPSSHTFFVRKSTTNEALAYSNIPFGVPVAGDFDGDGKGDFATYSIDGWFLSPSNTNYGSVSFIRFGSSGDKPVPADYDGDGRDDFAVYRPSDQNWYIRRSSGGITIFRFGLPADIPVPADYDGDGLTDFAVYRDGTWYVARSSAGLMISQFGLGGDIPVPSGYYP